MNSCKQNIRRRTLPPVVGIGKVTIALMAMWAVSLPAQRREIKPQVPEHQGTVPSPPSKPMAPLYRDLSGLYSFLADGESLQLTLEGAVLTGFISHFGDMPSDKGIFIDQFFSSGRASGDGISFVTKPLHGAWFEFKGRIARGSAKDRSKEGFYLIKGELTEYMEDENLKITARKREASFKSLPDDVNADAEATPKP